MKKSVHNTGTYFTDGRIAEIQGVNVVITKAYMRDAPKYFPTRLWYWLANKFLISVTGEEL